MSPAVVSYLGFVVAALILIWAVFEMTRRINRRKQTDTRAVNTWVKLDSTRPDAADETYHGTPDDIEPEDSIDHELNSRARRNGHHSESKKPLS